MDALLVSANKRLYKRNCLLLNSLCDKCMRLEFACMLPLGLSITQSNTYSNVLRQNRPQTKEAMYYRFMPWPRWRHKSWHDNIEQCCPMFLLLLSRNTSCFLNCICECFRLVVFIFIASSSASVCNFLNFLSTHIWSFQFWSFAVPPSLNAASF